MAEETSNPGAAPNHRAPIVRKRIKVIGLEKKLSCNRAFKMKLAVSRVYLSAVVLNYYLTFLRSRTDSQCRSYSLCP